MSLTTRHFRSDEPVPINKKIEERDRKRLQAVPDPTDKLPPGVYGLDTFEAAMSCTHRRNAYKRHIEGVLHCALLAEQEGNGEEAARARLAAEQLEDTKDAMPKEARND